MMIGQLCMLMVVIVYKAMHATKLHGIIHTYIHIQVYVYCVKFECTLRMKPMVSMLFLLHFILHYTYARYLVCRKMRQRMHKISLYYSLQDFFGHHGCPPELTPALTFHETLLLYEMPSPRFRLWFFIAVGHPICHAIPMSFGLGRHSCTALSFPCRNSPHSIWGCFLLSAKA